MTKRHAKLLVVFLLGFSVHARAEIRAPVIEQLWEGRLYAQALALLEDPAGKPKALRLTLLGEAFERGLGREADPVEAVRLYRVAAEAGNHRAQYNLGRAYERGDGAVAQNPMTAYTWYEKAADGHIDAAYRFGKATLANSGVGGKAREAAALERLKWAATQGHPEANVLLGRLYQSGTHVERDPARAMTYLAAAGEHPAARRALAVHHATQPDTHIEGIQALKALYEQGDAHAAAHLGHYAELAARDDAQRRIALEYYRAAGDARLAWVGERIARLEEHFRGPTVLGLRLYATTRAEVRARLEAMGVPLIHSDPNTFDAYDAGKLIEGAQSLTVAYAPGELSFAAELAYRFPIGGTAVSHYDARALGRFDTLRRQLNEKYGPGGVATSRRGPREYHWRVGEKTTIVLKKTDNDQILLVYSMAPFAGQLAQALANCSGAGQDGPIEVDAL